MKKGRRMWRRKKKGQASHAGRTCGKVRWLVRGGACVRACLRPTWQPFFTSFTSTDVVGEKLFLKADLKNLRCYKTNTHMCWCQCVSGCARASVCVCASEKRERRMT